MIIGTIIGSYGANMAQSSNSILINESKYNVGLLFSPNLIFSLLGLLVQMQILRALYPKDKMIQVTINSTKAEDIAKALIESGYPHGFVKQSVRGGYSNAERTVIETSCKYPESLKIFTVIEKVDPEAFINLTNIKGIIGNFAFKKGN
jgi:uncharacterized membrane-anchored protein YitT (DUF2179 family)